MVMVVPQASGHVWIGPSAQARQEVEDRLADLHHEPGNEEVRARMLDVALFSSWILFTMLTCLPHRYVGYGYGLGNVDASAPTCAGGGSPGAA
jgi:hypothetical protein